jgi:predicted transcriptional regulator
METVKERILSIISTLGEAYQSDLVRATGFSKSRVSEVLSELERSGIISRTTIGRNSRISMRTRESRKGGRIKVGFVRAAEYPFLIALRKILRENSNEPEFVVRENGIDVMTDLMFSRIDVAVAPILTQFVFHSIGTPLRVIGPAGSGGSSLVARKDIPGETRIASTKLSTMELLLRSCLNACLIYSSDVVYANSPRKIVQSMLTGKVDAACIWEPYATYLVSHGFKRLARYSEINDHVCCVISARSDMQEDRFGMLERSVTRSLELFMEEPKRYLEPYSALTGYSTKSLLTSLGEYSYQSHLDVSGIVKQFENAGLFIPDPRTFKEAFA